MQRWHIPFDYIEENWTWSEYLCMLGAIIISMGEQKKERKPGERSPSSFFK